MAAPDPDLILTNPTPSERQQIWTHTHPQWGTALTLPAYLDRETYLLDIPLARHGGLTPWILTHAALPPDHRPVLSSCETLHKRALVRRDGSGSDPSEARAHGVASVFTYPEHRGRGYARRMMALLAETLAARQRDDPGAAVCSVLFSDIGRGFYARVGWRPFESAHLAFPATAATAEVNEGLAPVRYDDLPALAAADEQLLRRALSTPIKEDDKKTRVALLPDHDTLLWHLHREDFMCRHIFSRTPAAHGVVYTPAGRGAGSRVWAIWMRGFYGGKANPAKNTLHLLRFVAEDGLSDAELAVAIRAIVSASQSEAQEWMCHKLELWNPDARVRGLVADMRDLGGEFVVREAEEIASLNWFGEGSADDVEWVANEKFGWC